MSFRFRGAIGGFNRDDVIAYIQQLTQAHQKERGQLLAELAKAHTELEQLRSELQAQQSSEPEACDTAPQAAVPEEAAAPQSSTRYF